MNCRVCTAPTTNFHYKIPSCRACAAFYKRTAQLKLSYTCAYSENCSVSEEKRLSCRYCRFKKCLAVGMTIEDLDTCPDIHLDPVKASSSYLPKFDHDFFSIENICGNHAVFIETLKKKMCSALNKRYSNEKQIWDTFLIAQADMAYSHHNQRWPCSKEMVVPVTQVDMNDQMVHFYKELLMLAEICSEIRPFAELPMDQKAILYKHFFVRFCQLDRAAVSLEVLGDDPNDTRVLSLDGKIWSLESVGIDPSQVTDYSGEQFKEMILAKEYRYANEFNRPFKQLKPDRFETLYLMMNCLWDIKGPEIGLSPETQEISRDILEKLVDELQFYYRREKKLENTASRIYKLHNLLATLDRIAEQRLENGEMCKVFDIFKMDIHFCRFHEEQ